MWSTQRLVAAGDTVIVWLTRDQVQPLVITPGKDFNTKFGNYKQADFVGVPYGSKVPSKSGRGFLHILRPTPELWTIALPHRTQILYLADIAFITSYLAIRRGSRVIEAGTGSASFSHSVARTIGPTGRLWSYEFHEARYDKAKEEFARHGMDSIVTIQHRNVCKDGFTVVNEADSVFLDLPAPWDAVEHAKKALRKDRITRICCFSPCMEQVLRTVNALNEAGFTEITMYETLLRPIEVFQVPALQPVSVVAEKIKKSEMKREEKRQRQIAANRAALANKEQAQQHAKRKRMEIEDIDAEGEDDVEEAGESLAGSSAKRVHLEQDGDEMDISQDLVALAGDAASSFASTSASALTRPAATATATSLAPATPMTIPTSKVNVSKVLPEVRGHTSYLTFACLIPIPGYESSSTTVVSQDIETSTDTPENVSGPQEDV